MIVDEAIKTVYWKRKHYEKQCIPPKGMMPRIVAEKWVFTYYSDKARKKKIGTATHYNYDYDYIK